MKKMNFKLMIVALMAMVGLSSCLGDSDSTSYGTEYVQVTGFPGSYSFKNSMGYTINAINSSVIKENLSYGSYAMIAYQFDAEKVDHQKKNFEAELQGYVKVPELMPYGDDSFEENAPMADMFFGTRDVFFYDKYNLFIPFTYFYKNDTDPAKLAAELNSHHFVLEPDYEDKEMDEERNFVLRLKHNVDNTDLDKERKAKGTQAYHVDLSYLLGSNVPTRITVKFKKSSEASMGKAEENLGQFYIEYKQIVDSYFTPKQ